MSAQDGDGIGSAPSRGVTYEEATRNIRNSDPYDQADWRLELTGAEDQSTVERPLPEPNTEGGAAYRYQIGYPYDPSKVNVDEYGREIWDSAPSTAYQGFAYAYGSGSCITSQQPGPNSIEVLEWDSAFDNLSPDKSEFAWVVFDGSLDCGQTDTGETPHKQIILTLPQGRYAFINAIGGFGEIVSFKLLLNSDEVPSDPSSPTDLLPEEGTGELVREGSGQQSRSGGRSMRSSRRITMAPIDPNIQVDFDDIIPRRETYNDPSLYPFVTDPTEPPQTEQQSGWAQPAYPLDLGLYPGYNEAPLPTEQQRPGDTFRSGDPRYEMMDPRSEEYKQLQAQYASEPRREPPGPSSPWYSEINEEPVALGQSTITTAMQGSGNANQEATSLGQGMISPVMGTSGNVEESVPLDESGISSGLSGSGNANFQATFNPNDPDNEKTIFGALAQSTYIYANDPQAMMQNSQQIELNNPQGEESEAMIEPNDIDELDRILQQERNIEQMDLQMQGATRTPGDEGRDEEYQDVESLRLDPQSQDYKNIQEELRQQTLDDLTRMRMEQEDRYLAQQYKLDEEARRQARLEELRKRRNEEADYLGLISSGTSGKASEAAPSDVEQDDQGSMMQSKAQSNFGEQQVEAPEQVVEENPIIDLTQSTVQQIPSVVQQSLQEEAPEGTGSDTGSSDEPKDLNLDLEGSAQNEPIIDEAENIAIETVKEIPEQQSGTTSYTPWQGVPENIPEFISESEVIDSLENPPSGSWLRDDVYPEFNRYMGRTGEAPPDTTGALDEFASLLNDPDLQQAIPQSRGRRLSQSQAIPQNELTIRPQSQSQIGSRFGNALGRVERLLFRNPEEPNPYRPLPGSELSQPTNQGTGVQQAPIDLARSQTIPALTGETNIEQAPVDLYSMAEAEPDLTQSQRQASYASPQRGRTGLRGVYHSAIEGIRSLSQSARSLSRSRRNPRDTNAPE